MNKLNVGDYVRYIDNFKNIIEIRKINKIIPPDKVIKGNYYYFNDKEGTVEKYIVKSSPNIIDLIEENDYIRIMTDTDFRRVYSSYGKLVIYRNEEIPIENFSNKFIGEIVTKESFENISYKVGE